MGRSIRVNVYQIIYFVLIFGAVFMDCPTGITFGLFGRCWLGIAIPFIFVTVVLLRHGIKTNTYINRMLLLPGWILIGSLISNAIYIMRYGNIQYLGENVFIKTGKTCMYWIAITMYLALILECTAKMSKKEILMPFLFSYFFLFVILLIELVQIPYAFEDYHYNAFVGAYGRVRLTTTESSTTVPLIICYGCISIYYVFYVSRSVMLRILVSSMFCVFVSTSGSKTLLLMCVATIVGILWVNRRKISKAYAPVILTVAVVGVAAAVSVSFYLWEKMLEAAGSTATRSIQLIAAVAHAFQYPFGNGGAAYMVSYKELLMWAYKLVRSSSIGGQLRYWEILGQINSKDDSVLGVIAGIWQLALYVGVCGLIYWLSFTWKYLKNMFARSNPGSWILKAMLIDIMIMWIFTTTMYNVYYMWAAILICGLEIFSYENVTP